MQKFYFADCAHVVSINNVKSERNSRLRGFDGLNRNARNDLCIGDEHDFYRFVLILNVFVGCFERVFVVGFQAVYARCVYVNVLHLCAVLPKRNCVHLLVCKRLIPFKVPRYAFFADLHVFEQNDCIRIDCFFVESVELHAVSAQIVVKRDNAVLIHGVGREVIENYAHFFADRNVF